LQLTSQKHQQASAPKHSSAACDQGAVKVAFFQSKPNLLPCLWVPEELQGFIPHLSQHFHVITPEADPTPGHHIIALKDERCIRRVLRKLQAAPEADATIFPAELLLFESLDGLMMKSQPADRWLEIVNGSPLELHDAVALAEDLLKMEPDELHLNLELEQLRQRVTLAQGREMSSWEWNKKYIEPLKAKLEKDFQLPAFGGGSGGGDGGDGGDSEASKERSADRTGKIVKHPTFDPLTIEEITEKIDELIAQGGSGSYLTGRLNRLAAASLYYVGELRKLYYERLEEADLECDRDINRTEIENLLNLNDQSLDLADYLPPSLSQPISQWCNWLNIRPAVALTALLAGISSVHKTGTELVLQRNQNFRVPSTIYAAMVSPSGQKKSPLFHNIIRRSLNTLEKEKLTAYEAAMEDYETALQQWEETKEGKKPSKPKDPSIYYFTNATGEAIPIQAAKDPSKTLLALIDELAGYFNSSNAYRGGRGSDKQDLLSYFDGSGQTILRASGVRVNLKNIYLSIFGTIQPDILKRHMEDCSDPDGNWARFLFVNQPLEAATLHDDDGMVVQISDRLTDFYRRIDQLPEMEYRLSPQAFKRYQTIYNQLERLRVTHPKSGMAAVYSKMEGYIGRLALNLHVLWELDAGKPCPDEEIPLFIMEMAIQLAKFYMGQVKLMHANADDESLPTHIVKVLELSKRLDTYGESGWIKAKNIQDMFAGKKRPSAQVARDWMNEAVALGFGQTRGKGNRLEYHWNRDNNTSPDDSPSPSNLGNLGNSWGTLKEDVPQVETVINQGIETNLGNLGKGIPKLDEEVKTLINIPNDPTDVVDDSESPTIKEGGYVPQASPTLPQEAQTVEESSISGFGNNLGNPSPTLPQVPQDCDSSAQSCVTVAAPKLGDTITELRVGDRVIWGECPGHCASFAPFEITAIEGDYAKLDLFSKLVPLSELTRV
jgi:hypothetical protein